MIRNWITEAKSRLPLPSLMETLGLAEHAGTNARCPLHEDRNESFSVFQGKWGWRFKCHAGCGEGDEIDFVRLHFRLEKGDAYRRFRELAMGSPSPSPKRTTFKLRRSTPTLPEDSREGERKDWEQVARIRHLSVVAIGWAVNHGTLRFGTVCGHSCWILTDTRGLCAEARRMDGKPFPAHAEGSERKAHTIKGSHKSWPVGLCVKQPGLLESVHWVALVEGGPDYLAALHFALAGRTNFLPVAMLGAGANMDPKALEMLRGKRVRIFAHSDPKGQGLEAAKKWREQLKRAGVDKVDGWSFDGLRMADGRPVKDLNDCTRIHPEDAGKLEDAWL